MLLLYPGHSGLYACGTIICATGYWNWCHEKAILMPNFSSSFCETVICLPPRGEIHAKWQGKRHAARRDERPYLRMMDHSSHTERKHSSKINALRGCYRSRVQ